MNCQGTISAANNGSINFNGGITVSGSGNVKLGPGKFHGERQRRRASSAGSLSACNGYVGNSGPGTFNQTGGLNSLNYLGIGNQGRYQFSGGTLQVNGSSLANQGVFDATGSTGVLSSTGSSIVNLSQATLENTVSMSLNIGPNSLLLVPAGFNPAITFGGYANAGLMHNVGTPLLVSSGTGFSGNGTITDFVDCQGTISAATGGSINLNGGVAVSGTGSVSLGLGSFIATGTQSGISAGSLSAFNGYVGYNVGDAGTFTVNGSGTCSSVNLYVGYSGAGTFNQAGGANNVGGGTLSLGYNTGSSGTYDLSGSGQVWAAYENVGLSGTAALRSPAGPTVSSIVSVSATTQAAAARTTSAAAGRSGLSAKTWAFPARVRSRNRAGRTA